MAIRTDTRVSRGNAIIQRMSLDRLDRLFLFCVYGPVLPVAALLAGWWGSIPFVPENRIFLWAFLGLALGVGADFVLLGRWMKTGYRIGTAARIALFLFYNIGVWGFFMGVPVFNALVGAGAGAFVGRGLAVAKAGKESVRKALRRTALFTTAVMLLVCIVSAGSALVSSSTPSDLSGMLGVRITREGVYLIIVIGGALLLSVQYWLTLGAGRWASGHRGNVP